MVKSKGPITIKKYANRRLYNTDSSSYVTLEFLSQLVRDGVEFVVLDAKSGDDITRQVLAQIIFEEESTGSNNLLSVSFLRDLISFYGKSVQGFFPSYLEMSVKNFHETQDQWKKAFSGGTTAQPMDLIANAMKANVEMFGKAAQAMTTGLSAAGSFNGTNKSEATNSSPELKSLQEQLLAMQEQLNKLANK